MAFTIACSVGGTAVHYGIGRHVKDLSLHDIEHALKVSEQPYFRKCKSLIHAQFWYLAEITYVITCFLIKLSAVLYLLRIVVKQSHVVIIYISLALYSAMTVVFFIYLMIQCAPVEYLWTQYSGAAGSCMSTHKIADLSYAHSTIGIVTDIALGSVPTMIVWNLKLTKRTRTSVGLVLGLGSL